MGSCDPRVYFAAERTLLAWIRTGLAVVALGFVIARFGLFLHLVTHPSAGSAATPSAVSAVIGILFVLLGATIILVPTWQQRRFVAALAPSEKPVAYSTGFALAAGWLMGLLALGLVLYLAVSSLTPG